MKLKKSAEKLFSLAHKSNIIIIGEETKKAYEDIKRRHAAGKMSDVARDAEIDAVIGKTKVLF